MTRTVGDGGQILAEIRAPIAVAEQDTGRGPVGTAFDHGYGQVLYTHGPSLDHPLQVTRLSYDSVFPNPVWITPHTNWQGSYDSGEITNSDNSGTCHRISSGWYDNTPAASETYGTNINGTGYTHPDSVTVCVDVDWPAPYQWKSMNERGRGIVGPAAWMGSLIEGGRDLTGQMYMRNRFYDPQSGRFTQEDPIGIAGGLNVYGFAGGDPVGNSDPYGLSAENTCDPPGSCVGKGVAVGTAVGAGLGVLAAGGCTTSTLGICTLAAPAIVGFFAAGGAAVGGLAGTLAEVVTSDHGQPAEEAPHPEKATPTPPAHGPFYVDGKGNVIPTPQGGSVTGSPDGRYIQARDAEGAPTGVRIDSGHKPAGHPDPRAQKPHAHVPGTTNPDGTPWLPVKQ